MADQEAGGMVLQWALRPDGRVQIMVAVPVMLQGPNGPAQVNVPVRTFILSDEERASLKATLSGLIVGAANGREVLL